MKAKSIIRSLVLAALFLMVPAHADFHFMKIVEIFPGTTTAPNAQYVVLQMYVSGQQFVANHELTVFDAAGSEIGSFTFAQNVSNGSNQAKILIGTAEAESFFNVSADLVIPPTLVATGGKVCFAGSVDCVAWGSWSGSTSGVGTPFNVNGGLVSGRAAIRRTDIAGSSITLDSGDDTNNCANDFVLGLPEPRNNAGQFGSIPASTCGNNAVEGLEQCDDGNLADGDGCSSTCAFDAVQQQAVEDDFDGDGQSDVFWRNTDRGRNAIWLSADATRQPGVASVSDLNWTVAGIGDFDGEGTADVFWRHRGSGRNAIWLSGDATQLSLVTAVSDLGWTIAGVGDFDGDGMSDLFWRNTDNGRNAIWLSASAASRPAVATVSDLAWIVVGVGDFDGDGMSDVFWRNTNSGRNAIWRSGDAASQLVVYSVSDPAWNVVGVGDFDGDGASDAFWRHADSGRNAIWLSANALQQQPVTGVTNPEWQVARTGDYDGNGTSDVFWRNMGTGRNAVWLAANASTQLAVTGVSDLAWMIVPYESQPVSPAAPDPEPGPVLTIANAMVTEGDSGSVSMRFTVQLSYAAPSPVTYDIATSDGTAMAGSDYAARSLSGETIGTGETGRTFEVAIQGDTLEEGDETLNVTVGSVSGGGATVGDGRARGTIRDDDSGYY